MDENFIVWVILAILAFVLFGVFLGNSEHVNSNKYINPSDKSNAQRASVKSSITKSNVKRTYVIPETFSFFVKGLNFRTEYEIASARMLEEGDTLILVKEPNHPVDPNAVKVLTIKGTHIGYIPAQYSQIVFKNINFIKSCKVVKIVRHPDLSIEVQVCISQYETKQPDFIKEEYQVSLEDNLIKLVSGISPDNIQNNYHNVFTVVSGTYELPNESILRARSLTQGEKVNLQKLKPTKYFPYRIDVYSEDGVLLGFFTDSLGRNIFDNFESIEIVYVDAPMSKSDNEHFAIRILFNKHYKIVNSSKFINIEI